MAVDLLSKRLESRQRPRRAFSIVYVGFVLLAAFGLISLAVDLGRVRVSRLQLTAAADAASLAGTRKVRVPDLFGATGARWDAETVSAKNLAIEGTGGATPVVVQDADVEFGLYRVNAGTFTLFGQNEPGVFGGNTVDAKSCNACRVSTYRTAARSNAVGLFFAKAIGVNTMDVKGRALAWTKGQGGTGIGIIGLDWVKFNGTTNTDSYTAANGNYGGNNIHNLGTVGSNGTITMVGTSNVHGNAQYGTDAAFSNTNNAVVSGWTAPLDYTLVYPVDLPPVAYGLPSGDDDANIQPPGQLKGNKFAPKNNVVNITFPKGFPFGRYAFSSFDAGGSNKISIEGQSGKNIHSYQGQSQSPTSTDFGTEVYISGDLIMNGGEIDIDAKSGPVSFYVSGDVKLNAGAQIVISNPSKYPIRFFCNGNWTSNGGNLVNPGDPGDLYISMTKAGSTMDISTQTLAHIMAPVSDITFYGNANNPPADFYGWVVGKTLNVKGNSQLHYDESLTPQGGPIHAVLISTKNN